MVERYFQQYAIVDQDILGSKESVDKVLALLPEDILSFPVVLSQYQYFCTNTSQISQLSVPVLVPYKKILEILNLLETWTSFHCIQYECLISVTDPFLWGARLTVISLSLTAHIKKNLTDSYKDEKDPMKRWNKLCDLVERKKVKAKYWHHWPHNNIEISSL